MHLGELFLGQSFGGLQAESTPQFLHDMDNHFILSGIEASFPVVYHLLSWLPDKGIQEFLLSRERLAMASSYIK